MAAGKSNQAINHKLAEAKALLNTPRVPSTSSPQTHDMDMACEHVDRQVATAEAADAESRPEKPTTTASSNTQNFRGHVENTIKYFEGLAKTNSYSQQTQPSQHNNQQQNSRCRPRYTHTYSLRLSGGRETRRLVLSHMQQTALEPPGHQVHCLQTPQIPQCCTPPFVESFPPIKLSSQ